MALPNRILLIWRGKWGRWSRVVAGAITSAFLIWVVIYGLDWGKLIITLKEISIFLTMISLIPLALGMLFRAVRWRILLNETPTNLLAVFLAQNTGIGLNNVLPIRMLSEPVQLAVITRRYGVPFPTALATLVAGNVMDIFASTVLMGIGVILIPGLRGASIQFIGAFILFIVTILVFIVASQGLATIPIARGIQFFQRLTISMTLLGKSPGRLWLSFLSTLTHWVLMGLGGWCIANGLGIDVDVLTMTSIVVATAFFMSAVPSLPGGIGTYEAAMVYSLGLVGIEQEVALGFALVMHILVFVPSSGIALFMLVRLGKGLVFGGSGRGDHAKLSTKAGRQGSLG